MKKLFLRDGRLWYDIPGYEGRYQINIDGLVRSCDRILEKSDGTKQYHKARLLKINTDSKGYYRVCLWKNNTFKSHSIHRMLATLFIPNPKNLPSVNHKDLNPKNNSIGNLEWCTHQYNCQHSHDSQSHRYADIGIIAIAPDGNEYNYPNIRTAAKCLTELTGTYFEKMRISKKAVANEPYKGFHFKRILKTKIVNGKRERI